MGELIKELTDIKKEAEVWDPDGNIEWDITVYVISLESEFVYSSAIKKYFFDKQEGIKMRDHINSEYPKEKPAKLLKAVVKLNRNK